MRGHMFQNSFSKKIISFFCEASACKIQTIETKKFKKLTVEDKTDSRVSH